LRYSFKLDQSGLRYRGLASDYRHCDDIFGCKNPSPSGFIKMCDIQVYLNAWISCVFSRTFLADEQTWRRRRLCG
jgi:hypothetical protein